MATILFTNIVLSGRTGTEVATVELARTMRARGHVVGIFSPTLGPLAQEARASGLPVTDRIEAVGIVPDVIHGHHNIPLALALLRFPAAPAVFTCHDSISRFDKPPLLRQVCRYVAVDAACRERMVFEGVPSGRIDVIANGVALDVFPVGPRRSNPPRRALLVVKGRTNHVPLVVEACHRHGVALEVVGPGVGRVVSDLPRRMREADIVFAWSRSALEAAATGASVIVADEYGYGGLIRSDGIGDWPETPLSRRILRRSLSVAEICADIGAADPGDAADVCAFVRAHFDLERLADRWETVYAQAMADPWAAEARAANPSPPEESARLAGLFAAMVPTDAGVTRLEDDAARDAATACRAEAVATVLAAALAGGMAAIPFGAAELGQALLGHGWYVPEGGATWSGGGTVSLWLPGMVLDAWDGRLRVQCALYHSPLLPPELVRHVAVAVDGHAVATWAFGPAGAPPPAGQPLHIPPDLRPPPGAAIRVTLRIDDPAAPAESGQSTDGRVLGLRLQSIGPDAG